MRITVELDTSNPDDHAALTRLVGAGPAESPAPPMAVIERGKAMTKAASDLGKAIGDKPKLSPRQKGQVAAKTRWSKKPKRQKITAPKIPVRREREQDFSKAVEEPPGAYPEVPGDMFDMPAPSYPDGRDIMEGTFKVPERKEEVDNGMPRPVDDDIG